MGLPKVEASCTPLVEKGANILNLPIIWNLINWAIARQHSSPLVISKIIGY